MTKSILYFLSTSDISSGATRSLLRLVSIVEDSDFRVIIILPEHGNVEDELVNKGIKYYVVKQYIWNYWIKYL
ncbi:TPA: glycosyltransferase family 1 protein, partial [Streptococcus pneumoniae]|nr:glycosyltransferase family 1 protein [Streptococcus pneumoniae]